MTYILVIVLALSGGDGRSATVTANAGGFPSKEACEAAAVEYNEQVRSAADRAGWDSGELEPGAICIPSKDTADEQ